MIASSMFTLRVCWLYMRHTRSPSLPPSLCNSFDFAIQLLLHVHRFPDNKHAATWIRTRWLSLTSRLIGVEVHLVNLLQLLLLQRAWMLSPSRSLLPHCLQLPLLPHV